MSTIRLPIPSALQPYLPSFLHPHVHTVLSIPLSTLAMYAALALPVLYVFLRTIGYLLVPKGIPGIPAPPGAKAIWGDGPLLQSLMKNGFGKAFDSISMQLGPIYQIRLGPFGNIVYINDLQSIEHLHFKEGHTIERAHDTINGFSPIIPTGQISIPTNEMWKHHRRLVGPSMTSKYLGLSAGFLNQAIGELVELWKIKASLAGSRSFKAAQDLEYATVDAISGVAFGSSLGTLIGYIVKLKEQRYHPPRGDLGEAMFSAKPPAILDSIMYIFTCIPYDSSIPRIKAFFWKLLPAFRKHQRHLNTFLDVKLQAARKSAKEMGAETAVEQASNTLDMMVARELKGEDWAADNEMRDELYLYLLAGTETTSTTLSWWLKYMTNQPDIQRKLRAHMLERLPEIQDRQPTFEDVNAANTPYLEAVVHETLRLCRTASAWARETIEDVTILGHVVPKGTTIIASTVAGLEDESTPIFALPDALSPTTSISSASSAESGASDDSDLAVSRHKLIHQIRTPGAERKHGWWAAGTGLKFEPERWLKDGKFDPNAGPSTPFSMGQRGCFGKNLALFELRLMVAQLNQAFFFAPVDENQASMDSYETITQHPKLCFIRPVSWEDPRAQVKA